MMLGVVQLARAIDKAKAVTHGTIGEYKYDCPMDQSLFEYLGMDPKAFLEVVNNAKSDYEIEAYAKTFVARKDPRSFLIDRIELSKATPITPAAQWAHRPHTFLYRRCSRGHQ
jgi:hypothetical protein